MTDPTLTHLYFLLDRSGSMQSMVQATTEGFDEFIAEQRASAVGKCRVTLAQFDDDYTEVYADRDLAEVPPLVLNPRGMTALLDALGRLIVTAGERLAALPEAERPGNVVVGVMTDGYENASNEWSHRRIKELIEHQTKVYGWEFMYLGADQDAIEEGAKMGFEADKSMTYSRGKAKEALGAMAANVTSYRRQRSSGSSAPLIGFSPAQRDDAR